MIEFISDWAGELVVALVIVTIMEMLLPENKTKKYIKMVIGLYIMFCIISPFINKKEFLNIFENTEKKFKKIQIESAVSNSQNVSSSIEDLYIQEFQKDIVKQVKELGYKVNKCEVSIEMDSDKENAGINSIILNIDKEKLSGQDIEIENIQQVEISINNSEDGEDKSDKEDTKEMQEIQEFLSNYYEISKDKIKIYQN